MTETLPLVCENENEERLIGEKSKYTKQYFNMSNMETRMNGDLDSIFSVLRYSCVFMKDKCKEAKNYKQVKQLYRFAHFMKGSTGNCSFDNCHELCKELLFITDISNDPGDEITDEMKKKLEEIYESIDVGCKIVDIYMSSKSG